MGVVHFAPLGRSPGAVTSALGLIRWAYESGKWAEFGLPDREGIGDPIEEIVLFTSPEVKEGGEVEEAVLNEIWTEKRRQRWSKAKVIDVVLEFVKGELAGFLPERARVSCYTLDPNDFDSCFETVAKAALKYSPPGRTGKHVWANLTGGTNVMNAAILQVSFLSGLIARLYYTFVALRDDQKFLLPPSRDEARFKFAWVPLFKTNFDEVFLSILKVLEERGPDYIADSELLAMVKSRPPYPSGISLDGFRREWLNKMDGGPIERRDKGNEVRISRFGRELLRKLDSPLFRALVQRGRGEEKQPNEARKFEPETLWTKGGRMC